MLATPDPLFFCAFFSGWWFLKNGACTLYLRSVHAGASMLCDTPNLGADGVLKHTMPSDAGASEWECDPSGYAQIQCTVHKGYRVTHTNHFWRDRSALGLFSRTTRPIGRFVVGEGFQIYVSPCKRVQYLSFPFQSVNPPFHSNRTDSRQDWMFVCFDEGLDFIFVHAPSNTTPRQSDSAWFRTNQQIITTQHTQHTQHSTHRSKKKKRGTDSQLRHPPDPLLGDVSA